MNFIVKIVGIPENIHQIITLRIGVFRATIAKQVKFHFDGDISAAVSLFIFFLIYCLSYFSGLHLKIPIASRGEKFQTTTAKKAKRFVEI